MTRIYFGLSSLEFFRSLPPRFGEFKLRIIKFRTLQGSLSLRLESRQSVPLFFLLHQTTFYFHNAAPGNSPDCRVVAFYFDRLSFAVRGSFRNWAEGTTRRASLPERDFVTVRIFRVRRIGCGIPDDQMVATSLEKWSFGGVPFRFFPPNPAAFVNRTL